MAPSNYSNMWISIIFEFARSDLLRQSATALCKLAFLSRWNAMHIEAVARILLPFWRSAEAHPTTARTSASLLPPRSRSRCSAQGGLYPTEPPTERASMHKAFRRIQHFEQFYFCVHRACQCVCFAFPTLTQFEHSKLRWILSEGLVAQRLQRCHGRKMKGSWQMTRLGNLLLASACILHLLLSVWLHCWIVLWLYFRRERFGNGTCDWTASRLQTKRSQGSFRALGKAVPRLWHWEGS